MAGNAPSPGSSNPAFPVVKPSGMELRTRSPVPAPPLASTPSFGVDDVYFTLFRHKWKILGTTLLGLVVAGVVFSQRKVIYQSNAKLFVRYVIMEGKAVRATNDDSVTKSPDMRGETIIASEQEILTSLDLARDVAQAVGPERILAKIGGGNDLNVASSTVYRGLSVVAPKLSSVINVTFQHPDPEVTQVVLRAVIEQYLKMHVEIHRSAGMVGDFLAQETDQLRSRLIQTEEELRKARAKAGVVSVEETKRSYARDIEAIRQQIFAARSEQAQRGSILQELTKRSTAAAASQAEGNSNPPPEKEPEIPTSVIEEYQDLLYRQQSLRKREQDFLTIYTKDNPRIKDIQRELAEVEGRKKGVESAHPRLTVRPADGNPTANPAAKGPAAPRNFDFEFEAAQLNAIEAKIKALTVQMDTLRQEAASLDQAEGTISELLRKKELEESNYRRYAASLEQSRINDALGTGKVSNISLIQTPSPPIPDPGKTLKVAGGIAAGGIGLGLAWAFLIELLFDRTVRRTADFLKVVNVRLFLSIPAQAARRLRSPKKAPRAPKAPEAQGENLVLVPTDPSSALDSALYPYHETLRDRLIGYFESRNLTHKPKLLAVTGLTSKTGVTTTATGLARCLSETGDGNVLLVDLTPEHGSSRQFYRGKATCGLEEMLSTSRESARVQERLFVVADGSNTEKLSRVLPHRFSKLVPLLKASDFDYIIFDMPPVSQISITPRLAGFMDMLLLVVESEKDSRDAVNSATALLAETTTHVGAILNKTRKYVPAWIHSEMAETP